jgi:hypothetical protein
LIATVRAGRFGFGSAAGAVAGGGAAIVGAAATGAALVDGAGVVSCARTAAAVSENNAGKNQVFCFIKSQVEI